jgi:hypothetical protein
MDARGDACIGDKNTSVPCTGESYKKQFMKDGQSRKMNDVNMDIWYPK